MATEYQHIIRFEGTDLRGDIPLFQALADIKGVGIRLSHEILRLLEINPMKRTGFVNDRELKQIKEIFDDPVKAGIPIWMVNRRKDYQTGKDDHRIGSKLLLTVKSEIDKEKRIRSWRGVRHMLNLKVRGQRTKTTGRHGRSVGVRRRKGRRSGKV